MELSELLKRYKHSITKGVASEPSLKESIYSYLGERIGDFFTKGELNMLGLKTRFDFDDKSLTSSYDLNKKYSLGFDVNRPNISRSSYTRPPSHAPDFSNEGLPSGHFRDDFRFSLKRRF